MGIPRIGGGRDQRWKNIIKRRKERERHTHKREHTHERQCTIENEKERIEHSSEEEKKI
jgi:hypothetical protein